MLYGAIETGGTKIICAKVDKAGEIKEDLRFPTGDNPEAAVKQITDFFADSGIDALGIGTFGPVCLDSKSQRYGSILETPKTAWRNYPLLERLSENLQVPMLIDTDVNCACLAESVCGAAKGLDSVIYITIGTGIGVGVYINGDTLKGMLHPEAGHIMLKRVEGDNFQGICPYHKDCFEGMAAGPALEQRAGRPAYELSADDAIWDIEAAYIGAAIADYTLTYSPQRIVLGGGVMEQKHIFGKIRDCTSNTLAGYIRTAELDNMSEYIVPAGLDGRQGIIGAYLLAKKACEKDRR